MTHLPLKENSNHSQDIARLQEQNILYRKRLEKLALELEEKEQSLSKFKQFEYEHKQTSRQLAEAEKQLLSQQEKESALANSLKEAEDQGRQLERVIEFLRERFEEAKLESKQIKDSHQTHLKNFQTLEQRLKQEEAEKQGLLEKLAFEAKEKQEALEEVESMHLQFEVLKTAVRQAESERDALSAEKAVLEADKKASEEKLKKNAQKLEKIEKECAEIKQALGRAIHEFKNLQVGYVEAANEKIWAISKSHRFEQQSLKMQEEIKDLKQRIHDLKAENHSLKETEERLAALVEEENRLSDESLKTLEGHIKQLKEEITAKDASILEIKKQAADLVKAKEDAENQLLEEKQQTSHLETKMTDALQHLAKKVKENAFLSEEIEKQKVQMLELQNMLAGANTKFASLKKELDAEVEKQAETKDIAYEKVKSLELQVASWERKYKEVQNRLEQTAESLEQLKAVERKHAELQNLLGSLSSVLKLPLPNPPIPSASSAAASEEPLKASALDLTPYKVEIESPARAPEGKPGDLFSKEQITVKYRQSLFD